MFVRYKCSCYRGELFTSPAIQRLGSMHVFEQLMWVYVLRNPGCAILVYRVLKVVSNYTQHTYQLCWIIYKYYSIFT